MPGRTETTPTPVPQPAAAPVAAPIPAPVALVPPPPAAPHSPAAQGGDEESAQRARLAARQQALREAPRAIPVMDLAVILGMQTKDSGRQEIIYDIGGGKHRILDVQHGVKEKVKAVTEEGQFIGFEPTGEYEFTLKVKYLRE